MGVAVRSALFIQSLIFSAATLAAPFVFAAPKAVIVIRHAEKPLQNEGTELSEIGWARAKALPAIFDRADLKSFGPPAALYAFKPKTDGTGSIRPLQTLKFVSEKFVIKINTDFKKKKTADLDASILADHTLDGKLVMICWEHDDLAGIAIGLGVKTPPAYPDDRFDRMWLIQYDASGVATLTDLPEQLLPGDSDK
jgi:hypothetical protein